MLFRIFLQCAVECGFAQKESCSTGGCGRVVSWILTGPSFVLPPPSSQLLPPPPPRHMGHAQYNPSDSNCVQLKQEGCEESKYHTFTLFSINSMLRKRLSYLKENHLEDYLLFTFLRTPSCSPPQILYQ